MAETQMVPPIVPHLCVRGGTEAVAFYERAFGATVNVKMMAEDGKRVMHANLAMFGAQIMLHDEFPEFGGDVLSPVSRHGASIAININLASPSDVNACIERAATAGAFVVMPAGDMFWGARYGRLRDPFGHIWAFNAPLADPTQ
jgi:PhnB protein